MRTKHIVEALMRLGFEPVLVSDRLAYRTVAEDGTPAYRYLARPRDIDSELWHHILDELPDIRRDLLRAEVLEVMRGMASEVGQPMPWEAELRPDQAGDFYRTPEVGGLAPFNGSPSLARAMMPLILARQRRPRTRAPLIVVLAPRHHWPAVRMTLSSLCAGHIHMEGQGHGEPAPDDLATVYDAPPEDEDARSRFWTESRGDSRRPRPLPVVLAEPTTWRDWTAWFTSCRRPRGGRTRPDTLPPMWAYQVAPDSEPLAVADALALWGGALALRESAGDSVLAVGMPEASTMAQGTPSILNSYARQCIAWLDAHEVADPPGSLEREAVAEDFRPD